MASELNTPPVLLKPFADSGDKNTIPETATGTQQASLDEGFPPVTSLPLTQGGIPPERKDFNGLGNLLSKQYFYLQNGGRFTFNQDVSDAIGGYPQNATLWYKDNSLGISYPVTSLINNNTYNFVTTPSYIDGVKWKRIIDSFPSTQITNCLTEILQDIKLELNNGTLTLKAGSKVYIPNGFDGTTPRFNVVTVASDISVTKQTNDKCFVFYYNNSLFVWEISGATSGTTAPSGTGTWYDTTNNLAKRYVSGSQTAQGLSLPLAILDVNSTAIQAIEQVFNGFGYIGSTVFALPGVKGLIPNGRNTDGTLKNIELETSSVITRTGMGTSVTNYEASIYQTTGFLNYDSGYRYMEQENILLPHTSSTIRYDLIFAKYSTDSNSKITSFTPKTAFHAVDYNDFSDLSDKVNTNISNITTLQNTKQDVATAVNYDNISNCITEIPQDIKLELNNGTLTLKAGSKVYVPNGFESDGTTPKFDVLTLTEDKSRIGSINTTGTTMICTYSSGEPFGYVYSGDAISQGYFSGPTAPTGHTYMVWYDTANNIIKTTANRGSTWDSYGSFPIAIVSYSSDSSGFTSIDQVFNGFGYIGSTVFALPGVKGLIPNGRNEDGTLKNQEFTINSVLTMTDTSGATGGLEYYVSGSSINRANFGQYTYNEKENKILNASGNRFASVLLDGNAHRTSGKVDGFNPKTPFHAVDYNDFEKAMLKEDWVKVSTPPASPDVNKFYYIPEN